MKGYWGCPGKIIMMMLTGILGISIRFIHIPSPIFQVDQGTTSKSSCSGSFPWNAFFSNRTTVGDVFCYPPGRKKRDVPRVLRGMWWFWRKERQILTSLRILTPQNRLFWGPGPLLYRVKPFHWRVQGFLGHHNSWGHFLSLLQTDGKWSSIGNPFGQYVIFLVITIGRSNPNKCRKHPKRHICSCFRGNGCSRLFNLSMVIIYILR